MRESVLMGKVRFIAGGGLQVNYLTQTEVEYWNRKGWYHTAEWHMDHQDHKEYLIWTNPKAGAQGYLKSSGGPMLPTVDHLQISREPDEQTT